MECADLRSDTLTRPTAGMRDAMARAEVGDDVFGEDPSVRRLQERVAELLGKEAALFVPSGTMANLLAIKIHTRPGDEVLLGEGSHPFNYESGGAAAFAGVQLHPLPESAGIFRAGDVRARLRPRNAHCPVSRLIAVENTHNRSGGQIFPLEEIHRLRDLAREAGLACHLDGARLLNASIASGVPPAEWAASFDSVSLCLSKGLGAPVGSLLASTRELVDHAHRFRKMLGGGMRQAGVLAAAGLYALDHHVDRLAEDHLRARRLGEWLAAHEEITVVPVRTNIVVFELGPSRPPAAEVLTRFEAAGLKTLAVGPRRIRLVTHLDVTDAWLELARQAIDGTLGR